MIRRLAVRSVLAALAAALFGLPVAVSSFPATAKDDTPYTFHVPLQVSDLNADTHRIPVDKIEVMCAVSESQSAHFPPVDAITGQPTGKSTDPSASVEVAVPKNGTLNQTVDIVVKGTPNERSYICGMRFILHGDPHPYTASALNKTETTGGSGATGPGQGHPKIPNTKPGAPDPGHPFDDTSLKVTVAGVFN